MVSSSQPELQGDLDRFLSKLSQECGLTSNLLALLCLCSAAAEKFEALILAESMISITSERWLIGVVVVLVLESSRVEVVVLLNELAYSKFEASKSSSLTAAERVVSKQRNLTVVFSLVESTIKLISKIGENEGDPTDESTFTQIIKGLNETIFVVLEYLQEAKDHGGQKKGNDLLASVRIVGRYSQRSRTNAQQEMATNSLERRGK